MFVWLAVSLFEDKAVQVTTVDYTLYANRPDWFFRKLYRDPDGTIVPDVRYLSDSWQRVLIVSCAFLQRFIVNDTAKGWSSGSTQPRPGRQAPKMRVAGLYVSVLAVYQK